MRAWLRRRGLGVNVAPQVGHSAVRRYVLGSEAHEREASERIQAMRRVVDRPDTKLDEDDMNETR